MNWVAKAALMAACSAAPGGPAAYRFLQRRFGNLDGGAMRRVPYAIALWDLLGRHGIEPSGAVFLEVGTGHKPVVPLMLYLLGAGPVHTVDRHRRLDRSLTAAAMRDMYARRDEIRAMAGDRVSPEVFLSLIHI
jgi:hypothetical protein